MCEGWTRMTPSSSEWNSLISDKELEMTSHHTAAVLAVIAVFSIPGSAQPGAAGALRVAQKPDDDCRLYGATAATNRRPCGSTVVQYYVEQGPPKENGPTGWPPTAVSLERVIARSGATSPFDLRFVLDPSKEAGRIRSVRVAVYTGKEMVWSSLAFPVTLAQSKLSKQMILALDDKAAKAMGPYFKSGHMIAILAESDSKPGPMGKLAITRGK